MKKITRIVQVVCCAVIIGFPAIYFVDNNAKAQHIPDPCDVTNEELADNFGDGTAYFGNVDVHVGGCWLSVPINCMVCGD